MAPQNDLAERLRDIIFGGPLGPGDRLPSERSLAVQLGVSRPMLREELRRLTDLGLVESRHGAGTFVAPVDLRELHDVRLLVEPFAARRAAERRANPDLVTLRGLLDQLHDSTDEPHVSAELDRRIHAEIARIAANGPLRATIEGLSEFVRHSHARDPTDLEDRALVAAELGEIVRAIGARDGDAAEAAMRLHLERAFEAIARTYAEETAAEAAPAKVTNARRSSAARTPAGAGV